MSATDSRRSGGRTSRRRTGRSGRWACRRSAHSAKSLQPNEGSDYVVVTHPFHPLFGQRLEVLFERRLATGVVLSCDCGPLGRMLLPAAWTDRVRVERPARLSYEVLVELAIVMAAIAGGKR